MSDSIMGCEHQFARFRMWPIKVRFICRKCSYKTRHYDSIDMQMSRPIHKQMSVAMRGFNTVGWKEDVR